ncbi:hypothetical protein ABZP36_035304 [Zizania latifolia]
MQLLPWRNQIRVSSVRIRNIVDDGKCKWRIFKRVRFSSPSLTLPLCYAPLTSRSYAKKEVSTHNTRNDCWVIIKDKVYDVTPYVEEHPGGDEILNNAGGDSTEGFLGPQHGPRVFDIIEDFCIGKLKE